MFKSLFVCLFIGKLRSLILKDISMPMVVDSLYFIVVVGGGGGSECASFFFLLLV